MKKLYVLLLAANVLSGCQIGDPKNTSDPPTGTWLVTDLVNRHQITWPASQQPPPVDVLAGHDFEVVIIWDSLAGVQTIDYSIPQAKWNCGDSTKPLATVTNLFVDKLNIVPQPDGKVVTEARYWHSFSWEQQPAHTAALVCGTRTLEGDTFFSSTGTTFQGVNSLVNMKVHACLLSEPTCKPF